MTPGDDMDAQQQGATIIGNFLKDTKHLRCPTEITAIFLKTLKTLNTVAEASLVETETASDQTIGCHQSWPITHRLQLQVRYTDAAASAQQGDIISSLIHGFELLLRSNDLSERLSLLDHAITATQDGVWDWNAQTQQVRYSDRWKAMLGYSPEEIPNHFTAWQALLHPDDAENANARAQEFFDDPRVEYHAIFRLKCKDGTYKWILSRGKAVEWADNETPIRIIGTHVDVDREKKLEESVISSNELLRCEQNLLIECGTMAAIGTWHVDLDNNTLFWSDKTKEIHGVDVAFEPGFEEAIDFFKSGWSRDLIEEKFQACVESGTPYDIELIIITQNNTEKWVRAIGMRAPSNTDRNLIYGLFQDIDDRIKTMKRLELEQQRAEEANIAKSEFLASMSHEIRTPINGVIGMISQLHHGNLSQRQKYQTDLALSSARSLLTVINDILDISKIECKKMELERYEFSAEQLFSGIAKSISYSVQERPVELYFSMFDNSTHWLIGDKGKIGQVFTNLLGNAVKFTERGEIHWVRLFSND